MMRSGTVSKGLIWFFLSTILCTTSHASPPDTQLRVIASFSIIGDMVQRVGGDRIDLIVLAGPGQDAHVYQPNPSEVRRVTQAHLIFSNGLGFEGWIARLLKAANFKGHHVVVSKGVDPRRDIHAERHGSSRSANNTHHHHHGGADPHAWQDVRNSLIYVRNMADGLCRADPHHCGEYRERSEQYLKLLARLHDEIHADWTTIEPSQRKVVTSHDAFAYYANAYGVRFLAPQGISTESAASAKGVGTLIQQIRRESIRALFVESVSDPRLIEQIARETGLRPYGALYSDSLSTPDGPASSYIEMMRYNTQSLIRAIREYPSGK